MKRFIDIYLNKPLINSISYLTIFLVAIAPFFSFIFFKVTHKYVTNFELLITLFILFLIVLERWNLKMPAYLFVYFLFVIYTLVSDKILAEKSINFEYLRSNEIVIGFLFLLVIENTKFDKEFFLQILDISFIVLIIAFLVIIVQEFADKSFFVSESVLEFQASQMRDYATYKLPSIYSYYVFLMRVSLCFSPILAMIIGHELYKSANTEENNNLKIYALYLIGIVFSFLSRTRIMLVFYALTFILFFIYKGFTLKSYIRTGVILVLAIVVLLFVAPKFGVATDKIITERILKESKEGGLIKGSTRYLAFEIFGKIFTQNKTFGNGRLSFTTIDYDAQGKKDIRVIRALHGRSSQIHVGYVALIYFYGFVGSALFIGFLVMATIYLYRNLKIIGYWGPFIAWIMYLLFHLTDVSFDVRYMGILLIFFSNKCIIDLNKKSETLL